MLKKYTNYSLLSVLLAFCCANIANAESVIRAAFDVGSGTTKMKVAKVQTDTQVIEQVLLENEKQVEYKVDLTTHKSDKFSEQIQKTGLAVLADLKKEAVAQGATQFVGVATAAFRQAANAKEYLAKVKSQLAIDVNVISQEQEALLGYYGAMAHFQSKPEELLVWDIGGGSMQMIARDSTGKFITYLGGMGSVVFKDLIITDVQKKSASQSPNPISREQGAAALALAKKNAVATVPKTLQTLIKSGKMFIAGIGGVHYYSVRGQIGAESGVVNVADVAATLEKRLNLDDAALNSLNATTQVSNLILVKGFMQALGINELHTAKINLTDGVLVHPN